MKVYVGDRTIDGILVTADGQPLAPREDVAPFASNGFEWSYEGPEPLQLAFALLFDHLGDADRARRLAPEFMRRIVANFDNGWEMTSADIEQAVAALEGGRRA